MKERPILFSAPMVRAILEGRKTMTRRMVKPQPGTKPAMQRFKPCYPLGDYVRTCRYGVSGDRLWVKETFRLSTSDDCACYEPCNCKAGIPIYRADFDDGDRETKWKPSIFMPRWASRITLEVTDVRVERLQEISDDNCQKEGVALNITDEQIDGSPDQFDCWSINAYRSLWESINGKGSWNKNPWVWVVSFKRI